METLNLERVYIYGSEGMYMNMTDMKKKQS